MRIARAGFALGFHPFIHSWTAEVPLYLQASLQSTLFPCGLNDLDSCRLHHCCQVGLSLRFSRRSQPASLAHRVRQVRPPRGHGECPPNRRDVTRGADPLSS